MLRQHSHLDLARSKTLQGRYATARKSVVAWRRQAMLIAWESCRLGETNDTCEPAALRGATNAGGILAGSFLTVDR